jgi:dynein heavy chain
MIIYETLCVRHGVMVVGGAMGMKTSIIHMLAQGLTAVADKALFPSVRITTLNPKSVTYGQLYGTFDPNTREWMEGIASYVDAAFFSDKM